MSIVVNRYKSYLAMIKNSPGTKMFRSLFVIEDGEEHDAYKEGELSCAAFVSSVLRLHNLIDHPHATVARTVEEMEKFGWEKTEDPKPGSIIVYKSREYDDGETHGHIGFYVGEDQVVSTSYRRKEVVAHPITELDGTREVLAYYWHEKLDG